MKLPLYQIDAFTRRPFAGNPAAVVVVDTWPPDRLLQAIAAENNLSETAFVQPRTDDAPLRWFTPTVEVDLCGHATLAAGHVLLTDCFPGRHEVSFRTLSGRLAVRRAGERLWLDFPARPAVPAEVSEALCAALGARPREAWRARDLVCVFESAAEIVALTPDFVRLARLDVFAVCVTAPGDDVDFVCRFFAPRQGIPEDPVTGSAYCTLAPLWAERLGKSDLVARQLSKRGGEVACVLQGERVAIGGEAAPYLRGTIIVPD